MWCWARFAALPNPEQKFQEFVRAKLELIDLRTARAWALAINKWFADGDLHFVNGEFMLTFRLSC